MQQRNRVVFRLLLSNTPTCRVIHICVCFFYVEEFFFVEQKHNLSITNERNKTEREGKYLLEKIDSEQKCCEKNK